jgi:hypothetical protein
MILTRCRLAPAAERKTLFGPNHRAPAQQPNAKQAHSSLGQADPACTSPRRNWSQIGGLERALCRRLGDQRLLYRSARPRGWDVTRCADIGGDHDNSAGFLPRS